MNKLCVLIENRLKGNYAAQCEHGLSLYLELDSKKILFDVGSSGAFIFNASLMGIDLNNLDCIVLSHGHYDHVGGFKLLVKQFPVPLLLTGVKFFKPKYVRDGKTYSFVGNNFTQDYLLQNNINNKEVKDIFKISNRLYAVSGYKKYYDFDCIPEDFVEGELHCVEKCNFLEQEVSLVIENIDSLNLIVGCSHPGILSMVKDLSIRFSKPVIRIIGGIHLNLADEARLEMVAKEMKKLGVQEVELFHCSGEKIAPILLKGGINTFSLATCGMTNL